MSTEATQPELAGGNPAEEGNVVAPAAAAAESTKPLYTGLSGEIKTAEELIDYAKKIETLYIAGRATQKVEPQTFHSPAPVSNSSAASTETFENLIYSDPVKAKQVVVDEVMATLDRQSKQKEAEAGFWQSFYQKNTDLKDLQHVVQSVFKRDKAEIGDTRRFPDNNAVAEYVAKEARSLVGLIKEKTGLTETRVDSQPAITFGSSGEPSAARPASPAKPVTFAQQLSAFKTKRK